MKIGKKEGHSPEPPGSTSSQKSQSQNLDLFKPILPSEEAGGLRRNVSSSNDLTSSPRLGFWGRVRSAVFGSQSRMGDDSLPSTPFSPNSTFTTPEVFTPISTGPSSAEEFLRSQGSENICMKEACQKALQQMEKYRAGYQIDGDLPCEIQKFMKKGESFVDKQILADITRGVNVSINSQPLLSPEQISESKVNSSAEAAAITQIEHVLDEEKVPVHVRPYLNQTIANQIFSVLQQQLEEAGIPIEAESEEGFGIALRRDLLTPVSIDLEKTRDCWTVKGNSIVIYQDTDPEKADEDGWKVVGSFKIDFFIQIPEDPNIVPTYHLQAS